MSRPMAMLVAILAIAGCKGPGTTGGATDPFFGRTRVEPPRTGTISGQTPTGASLPPSPSTGGMTSGLPSGQGGMLASGATSSSVFPPSQLAATQSGWSPPGPKVSPSPSVTSTQPNGGYQPPDGSFGFPTASAGAKSASTLAGTGDRISIPVSARGASPYPSGPAGRSEAASPGVVAGTTGPSDAIAPGPAANVSSASPGSRSSASPYLDNPPANTLVGRERIVRVIEGGQGGSPPAPPASPTQASPSTGSGVAPSSPTASDKPVNIADLPEARS